MADQEKTKAELINELQKLQHDYQVLKGQHEKNLSRFYQKEDDIRETNQLLSDVQKLAQIGIWEWDKATDYVTWSKELFQIAGLDESLQAPSYSDHHRLYTPGSWNTLKAAVENALNTGESYRLELDMIRPDGTIRNVRAIGGVRFNVARGKITGLYGLVQDETEHKITEMALRESEANLERVINKMIETFSIINGEGEFIFANIHAANNLTGGKSDDIKGRNIRDFVPPEQANRLIEAYRKVISTQQPVTEEKKLSLGGCDKWFLNSLQYVQFGSEKTPAVVSISLDITKNKQAEEAIVEREEKIEAQNENLLKINEELKRSKEKAEESDRLKSAFLANMSHEIRTPMNGILGFADLLKEPNLSGDEQKEYIRIIEKSGARMLNTINEIIDISKIEAGLMEIAVGETNINELLQFMFQFMFQFFKPEADTKSIVLSLQGDLLAQNIIIKTDKVKLQAILFNLIKNSVKYTKTGSIEFGVVSTGTIIPSDNRIVEKSQNAVLQFYVKDTGIGIPTDRQQAIFERFIQADVLDKNAYQGSGLGLSISKAYVEMLGGQIWLKSSVGNGTTFYFTIPYNSGDNGNDLFLNQKKASQIEAQIKPESSGLKVLIVEDDETSALLISETVKAISKEILIATTGIQAIDRFRSNPDIDLILMDVRMPEMDGYEAIRRIRQFNKKIFIIAQTAHALTGDREKALAAGANDYISKPVRKDKLLKLIQTHFKK